MKNEYEININEDKDIINSIAILQDIYKDRINITKIDFKYSIIIDNKEYKMDKAIDIKKLIEDYYNIKNLANDKLFKAFENFVYDYMYYKNMLDDDKMKIYIDICPLIDELFEKYKKIKMLDSDTGKYFNGIDGLNYNGLSEYLTSIIISLLD